MMRTTTLTLLLALIVCSPRLTAAEKTTLQVSDGDFLGWPAITLSDGVIRAVLIPEIGRLAFLGEDRPQAENRLWLNPEFFPRPDPLPAATTDEGERRWRNFGGFKVWPYPWTGWPPDSDLDGGPCSVERGEDFVALTTKRSERLDTQVRMAFAIDDQHRLRIDITMDSSKARAIWPVVQVPAQGLAVVPLDPQRPLHEQVTSPHVEAAELAEVLSARGDGGLFTSAHAATHRKFDVTTAGGWIAYQGQPGNLRLRWQYPHPKPPGRGHDGSFYFNDQSDPAMQYLELECYSPVVAGSHEWSITLDLAEDLHLP